MFNEREMSKAIDWLFELFSPEDYEGYDEDEMCVPQWEHEATIYEL